MNAPTNPTNLQHPDVSREAIRAIVRGVYDLQKMRIETGNRLVLQDGTVDVDLPSTPAGALDQWKKSPLHNAVILNLDVWASHAQIGG